MTFVIIIGFEKTAYKTLDYISCDTALKFIFDFYFYFALS